MMVAQKLHNNSGNEKWNIQDNVQICSRKLTPQVGTSKFAGMSYPVIYRRSSTINLIYLRLREMDQVILYAG